MQGHEQKLNEWHRLSTELGAALQRLAVADRHGALDTRARVRIQMQVIRLERESAAALEALRREARDTDRDPNERVVLRVTACAR